MVDHRYDFDRLLRPKEAAERLGITPRELAKWRRERRVACFRFNARTYRYIPSNIEALLEKRRRMTAEGSGREGA